MPLAHMGGVPEALSLVVPMLLVFLLLRAGAKRREAAEAAEAEQAARDADAPGAEHRGDGAGLSS